MTKKIIAIACAVVLVVLVFASCTKKPKTTTINGYDYVLVTDAEGNTVLSSDGMLRAYVLDEKGYIVTNTDGSNAEKLVSLPNDVAVGDNSLGTAEYSLTMPKGWTAEPSGKFIKDKTDNKCSVSMGFADKLEEITFDEYVQKNRSYQEGVIEQLRQQHPEYKYDAKFEELTLSGHPTAVGTYKITDEKGKVTHYAVQMYYYYNEQAYYVNYVCVDGAGYDESFDFVSYIQEHYIIK